MASTFRGLLGEKLGMTQVFDENNRLVPVTVVKAGPCVVTQVRTPEVDGYSAVQLGFGGMRIANLFAWRATRPQELRTVADPVGPENAALLEDWCAGAEMTLAAWGVHGALMVEGPRVAGRLTGDVRHLGLTREGHPRHPLYVPYARQPAPWPVEARYPLAV